jgi:hypothetical protein
LIEFDGVVCEVWQEAKGKCNEINGIFMTNLSTKTQWKEIEFCLLSSSSVFVSEKASSGRSSVVQDRRNWLRRARG